MLGISSMRPGRSRSIDAENGKERRLTVTSSDSKVWVMSRKLETAMLDASGYIADGEHGSNCASATGETVDAEADMLCAEEVGVSLCNAVHDGASYTTPTDWPSHED